MSSSGVLPELPTGWTRKPLGHLLSRLPGYGINAAASRFSPDAPTYIRITDIDEDGRFRPKPKVSVRHPLSHDYRLADGDLVFARTGATVGKSYRYSPTDGQLVFAGFLIRVTPNPAKLDPRFLGYYVQSERYWDWVRVMSARSGQPGINGVEYTQMPVDVPPLAEQRAIADELANVDQLIASLGQLIAKKQDVKQGAMRQLLTGETRLPGLDGDWHPTKVASLGQTYGGLTGKKREDFGSGKARYVPFMAVMEGVTVDGRDLPRVAVADSESQNRVAVGDLLFNGSSETPDELALCATVRTIPPDTYLNSFCFGFRLLSPDESDPMFIAYLFRSGIGRKLLRSLAQGAIRYNLSKVRFRELEIVLPSQDEQRAIAGVLSDMNAEIEALEARLAKTRNVKRGMMQELLTGRTRRAVDGVARE